MSHLKEVSTLPSDIKKAAMALIVSCVSTLIGVYFDGIEFPEIGFGDPLTLSINIGWVFVIAWTIFYLLYGRKDIKLAFILVGAVIFASLVWDLVEFGFSLSQLFYSIELAMFVFAYFLLRTHESRDWYAAKNS